MKESTGKKIALGLAAAGFVVTFPVASAVIVGSGVALVVGGISFGRWLQS